MKKLFAVSAIVSLAFTACDTDSNLNSCDYDESAMLTNYADNIIIPRFDDLATATELLHGSAQAFQNSPSLGTLDEVRVFYRAAYKQYQRCSSFAFGPGLVDGLPFRDRFNTFPVNTTAVESNISSGTSVGQSAQSAVGFPAMEYLIYPADGQTNQDILDAFTTGADAAQRMVYLVGLSEELKNTSGTISDEWQTYRDAFVSNTGTAVGTSISMMTNEFNRDFEIMKNFKFKVPLGKLNGGVVLPDKVEGYYAGNSVELATEQTAALKALYLGVGENNADGEGLYDYLDCLKTESSAGGSLADYISERFDLIQQKLDVVPDPLSETLQTNKPIVDEAYTEMQMTVPSIKHEMTTAFGVQINYESGDGD
jgi:hypothetical protein